MYLINSNLKFPCSSVVVVGVFSTSTYTSVSLTSTFLAFCNSVTFSAFNTNTFFDVVESVDSTDVALIVIDPVIPSYPSGTFVSVIVIV